MFVVSSSPAVFFFVPTIDSSYSCPISKTKPRSSDSIIEGRLDETRHWPELSGLGIMADQPMTTGKNSSQAIVRIGSQERTRQGSAHEISKTCRFNSIFYLESVQSEIAFG